MDPGIHSLKPQACCEVGGGGGGGGGGKATDVVSLYFLAFVK